MASDKFAFAYAFTKKWEGGYSDHPLDKGGPTNYGITLDSLKDYVRRNPAFFKDLGMPSSPSAVTTQTVKKMTASQAERIFEKFYWSNHDLDQYPQRTAAFLFDCCVNNGWGNAVLITQRGYNDSRGNAPKLEEDGKIGPKSTAAFIAANDSDAFIRACIDRRERFYQAIVRNNGSQSVFLVGWLNRISDQRKYLGG